MSLYRSIFSTLLLGTALLAATVDAGAQDYRLSRESPPPVAREFRGVWIASVWNINWPSKPGLPAATQKKELIALLDKAASLNLNAVILQVAGDRAPWLRCRSLFSMSPKRAAGAMFGDGMFNRLLK